jgi:hypothetical protein
MPLNPDPSFLTKEAKERTYHACGKIALNWGPIEMLIEFMLVNLRHRQRPAERGFPISFSRKIDELKDRLKREGMTDVADTLRPLLARAKALHVLRTHVVHSYFQGQRLDGRLMFGRSDQKRGVAYTERNSNYSIDEIEQAARDFVALHDELEPIALSVRAS